MKEQSKLVDILDSIVKSIDDWERTAVIRAVNEQMLIGAASAPSS